MVELIVVNCEEICQGNFNEEEIIEGFCGGYYNGFWIYSVCLLGVFVQQEVVFGDFG